VRDSPLLLQEVQDMRAAVVTLQSNMAKYVTQYGIDGGRGERWVSFWCRVVDPDLQ
jgi:hypothetical protein